MVINFLYRGQVFKDVMRVIFLRYRNELARLKRQYGHLAISLLFLLLVVGCGGGSQDQLPERIPPIQVSANVDVSVNEQTKVVIEGAALGGKGALTYAWQADAAIVFEHKDTSSATASLTTPTVTSVTEYIVKLIVTDERQETSEDTFTLTVNPVNQSPTATITVNSLPDYPARQFPVQAKLVLDGSASSDSDAPKGESPIATYQWQQIAGTRINISDSDKQSKLEITTPVTEQQETVIFELEVTDREGASASAQVQIILLGQSGTRPELVFNTAQDGFSGERLLLDLSASSKAPNASPYQYLWLERSGNFPALQIEDNTKAVTYVTLPQVDELTALVFEAEITDSFGNSVTSQKTINVYPFPVSGINDTGVMQGADASLSPGADFDFGRDRAFANNVVTKVGQGIDAFDFTRLNSNGDPVDTPTNTWSCVRDNLTGLIWEVKAIDQASLHYHNQNFTWYQEDFNGNLPGDRNTNSNACNISSRECNTQAFLNAVNQQGLCGFFDWRIPTHQELQSIVHYGKAQLPLVDTGFLPHWGDAQGGNLWYWTRQSGADGLRAEEARSAWAIDFNSGVDNLLSKSSDAKLRLVRAGRTQPNG